MNPPKKLSVVLKCEIWSEFKEIECGIKVDTNVVRCTYYKANVQTESP
jgi:hypothetical protein